VLSFRSDLHQSMWGAMAAFAFGALAMMIATRRQPPKTDEELHGLVHGLEARDASATAVYPWFKNPVIMGVLVLLFAASGYGLILLL
jgi:solute:Na+ symporter, SSS family